MNTALSFTPDEFDSVLSISDLTIYIAKVIQQIRQQNLTQPNLFLEIDNLAKIFQNGINSQNINELLTAYKSIQQISMKLRKMLSEYVNLEVYDNISYAFYYNGKRFSTDNISASWLTVNSKGELRLQLDKAAESLSKDLQDEARLKIQEIFSQHYQNYLAVVSAAYLEETGYELGKKIKGSKLNRGHVAEAYEIHISEHHPQAYRLLNEVNKLDSVMEKMSIVQQLQNDTDEGNGTWHETANEMWRHIRSAMGTQRGTVAGDVGRFQVKQGFSSNSNAYSSQVRLASLSTLKNGIKIYSDILNYDIDATQVAYKIAMYMSEPVANNTRNIQAYIANKNLSKEFENLDEAIKNIGRLRHI